MNKLVIVLMAFFAVTAISCSDNDEPGVPSNAITLNMMLENSSTTIGGSDVFINAAGNFATSECGIADLGKKGGFNPKPNLTQIAQEVAVTPGNYYQIVLSRAIRNVAGARAYPINTNFYNVFVDSWIYDKDGDMSGAKVSYAECYPEISQLPEWNAVMELSMKLKNNDSNTEVAEYTFPKGCSIDSNYDVYDSGQSDLKNKIDISTDGNRIFFSNSSWTPGGAVQVVMLVRYESVYTRVIMNVASNMR